MIEVSKGGGASIKFEFLDEPPANQGMNQSFYGGSSLSFRAGGGQSGRGYLNHTMDLGLNSSIRMYTEDYSIGEKSTNSSMVSKTAAPRKGKFDMFKSLFMRKKE